MDIVILTTAINRPELHSKPVNDLIRLLEGKYNLHWIINIDYIGKLNHNRADTIENYNRLIGDNAKVYFTVQAEAPNFLNAALTVCKKALELTRTIGLNTDTTKYMWLEDDWVLSRDKVFVHERSILHEVLGAMQRNSMLYLAGRLNNGIGTFRPKIMGYDFFYKYHFTPLSMNTRIKDPERVCKTYCKKKVRNQCFILVTAKNRQFNLRENEYTPIIPDDMKGIFQLDKLTEVLTITNSANNSTCLQFGTRIFVDAGREWMMKQSIKKWPKLATAEYI